MSQLIYKQATDDDLPVIFSLCKALIDKYEDLTSIDYDKVLLWVEKKLKANISEYSCVLLDGTKVGYYRFTRGEKEWELDDLYVLPEFRNQGIGTKILEHCLKIADAPVFLYVFSGNTSAIRLYERMGFRETETVSPTRKILHYEG